MIRSLCLRNKNTWPFADIVDFTCCIEDVGPLVQRGFQKILQIDPYYQEGTLDDDIKQETGSFSEHDTESIEEPGSMTSVEKEDISEPQAEVCYHKE